MIAAGDRVRGTRAAGTLICTSWEGRAVMVKPNYIDVLWDHRLMPDSYNPNYIEKIP